jgi:hypothetical protein
MLLWDEDQKHGQGNDEERIGFQSLFASNQPKKAEDEKVCLVDLNAMLQV